MSARLRRAAAGGALLLALAACYGPDAPGGAVDIDSIDGDPLPNAGRPNLDQPDTGSTFGDDPNPGAGDNPIGPQE